MNIFDNARNPLTTLKPICRCPQFKIVTCPSADGFSRVNYAKRTDCSWHLYGLLVFNS